jgi:hypothetical protein
MICSKKPFFTVEQLFSLQYPARPYFISLAVTKCMSQNRKWIWRRWEKSTDNFRFLHWIALAYLRTKMSLAVFVTLRNKVDPPLWHGLHARLRLCRKGSQAVSFFLFWTWIFATAGTFGYCQYGRSGYTNISHVPSSHVTPTLDPQNEYSLKVFCLSYCIITSM